jgi:hypothetical protein
MTATALLDLTGTPPGSGIHIHGRAVGGDKPAVLDRSSRAGGTIATGNAACIAARVRRPAAFDQEPHKANNRTENVGL